MIWWLEAGGSAISPDGEARLSMDYFGGSIILPSDILVNNRGLAPFVYTIRLEVESNTPTNNHPFPARLSMQV